MYWTDFKKIKFRKQHQLKNGRFVTMETVTFKIRSSEKYLFGFNHLHYVVKQNFFKKNSRAL